MKQKRVNKTIFKVTCNISKGDNEATNKEDFHVGISNGVTATEMGYSLSALLSVVLAHENANGGKWTTDGFLHYIGIIMNGSEVGIAKTEHVLRQNSKYGAMATHKEGIKQ